MQRDPLIFNQTDLSKTWVTVHYFKIVMESVSEQTETRISTIHKKLYLVHKCKIPVGFYLKKTITKHVTPIKLEMCK